MKSNLLKVSACAFLACASVCAWGQQTPQIFQFTNSNGTPVMLSALSDNALYAIGSTVGDTDVDNPHTVGGVIYNLETRQSAVISSDMGWAEVNDVSDNGIVVGQEHGNPAYWDLATMQWTSFPASGLWDIGSFLSVTPDGNYAVGYLGKSSDLLAAKPLMYNLQTGERVEISNLPTVDLSGENQNQNVFYAVSPDGRYVLGQMSQSFMMPLSMFSYIYDVQEQTWTPIGYTFNPSNNKFTPTISNLHFIDNQSMSCDGAWVTGAAYVVNGAGQHAGGDEFFAAYRYNVANNELEIYDGADEQDVGGNRITANGDVLASSPIGNPYPAAMVRYGKFFISLDQILDQVYHTRLSHHIGDNVTGSFQALSADGLTAIMRSYDNCYVIRMPESFVEAASKVDLLASYTPSIPENSRISKIGELKIVFDRAIGVSNQPSAVKLLDGQGNTVRSASGFVVSSSNDHELVVTFRSTSLNPGEKYTVAIPEGMVWLKDDMSIKARAINLSYIGRSEGPIQATRFSPASGSSIAQFNSSPDVLTVTFDSPVKISGNASCVLYNADDNSVVTSFAAAANGQQAIFYPSSTHYLYRGSNYKVVIAAGSVTDLSDNGACEEIVLLYQGAYVREISSDDKYIFNSSCDNYENFMMHKTEVHNPASTPAEWGFSEDNMWIIVADNQESTDMALCAHSMFVQPAQADDWLTTPQLFIPDAKAYLSFDAQSYLKNKHDVLKVYIYESDAHYNYLNNEIVEMMRAEGDLVFDEELSPGATQEGLDGEWAHYNIDLAPYAGKNIYIAFVNHNFDQSAVFLDNIRVVREMAFLVTNKTPERVVDADEIDIKGFVTIDNELASYTGISLKLMDGDGELVDEINDAEAALAYGDTYQFAFATPLALVPGEINKYSIEVKSGEDATVIVYEIKNLMFEPILKVVLEEYTGASCGNCPMGIRAIENLQSLYPDNFIAVTLRTYGSDRYGTGLAGYSSFLGCENVGAPSGRINRGPVLAPMLSTPDGYKFNGRGIIESNGNEAYLWADAVQDELDMPAEAEITATASYDPQTGRLTVPCNIRFALNTSGRSINVFAVVLEDYLPTSQENYVYNIADPALGEWGLGGMYGKSKVTTWLATDVTRYVVNGNAYNGTAMSENDFDAGVDYSFTLDCTIPDGRISDLENAKVAVMLIDGGTEKIINANEARIVSAGIESVETDQADAVYYNLQGLKVANPESGRIYIRVVNGKATKIVK